MFVSLTEKSHFHMKFQVFGTLDMFTCKVHVFFYSYVVCLCLALMCALFKSAVLSILFYESAYSNLLNGKSHLRLVLHNATGRQL